MSPVRYSSRRLLLAKRMLARRAIGVAGDADVNPPPTPPPSKSTERRVVLKAPVNLLYDHLRLRGMTTSTFKPKSLERITPFDDSVIINYFSMVAMGLLFYYRCCDNLKSVKRLVQYQVRWSLYHTLAHKHKSSIKKVVQQFGEDPEAEGVKFPRKDQIMRLQMGFMIPKGEENVRKNLEENRTFIKVGRVRQTS